MAGRPRYEVTDDHVRQIRELAGHGLTQEQIADFFGWSDRTLRNRLTEDEGLSAAYKIGRAQSIESVAKTLYEKAIAGDTVSCIFYLKTQAQWRETNRTELTGKDGAPIQQEIANVDSPRERILGELSRLATRASPNGGSGQVHGSRMPGA